MTTVEEYTKRVNASILLQMVKNKDATISLYNYKKLKKLAFIIKK